MSDQTARAIRISLFTILVFFITFGPFYRQVLGGKSEIFRRWVMFAGFGRNICSVQFFEGTDFSPSSQINRLQTLGYEGWWSAPRSVRRLKSKSRAKTQGKKLCSLLKPKELSMRLQCGSRRGWQPYEEFKNICGRSKEGAR